MTDSKTEQIRRLFGRAIELPGAARTAFLDRECGADADLKRRLRSMLAAAGDERFAAVQEPEGVTAVTAALAEGPGTRIGPYKLLQLIGEGGFGAVFMAEQEKPVARKVALKIIKLGMDTRQVVARFEQERQALALMDHPNIARVLDAGATETGRPYFVMDLVKGDPIEKYCDRNNLSIDERLELFAQVCSAVQHAHGKGIIHRDLKPSNILVGTLDGKPQAKVIDFGIAKATSSKLTDKTLFTEHHQVIGTLQYMSPEQAEGSLDIDTRTDVYSLGVLLYELLTGSTPFDQKTVKEALYGELQRMIREVEPPKPSTRLRDSHHALASIAAHRRTEPRRLGTLLRGELDWIVMKALEKDRARRYETANGLAQDIRRYLGGEAVVAAPPSAVYRLRKFVRRHKATVTAAIAVATALLAGLIAFAWQANVAWQLSVAEAQQRAIAETNERKAAAINQFLLDMLGSADLRAFGREAKVAQALTKAGANVGKAFADRPEIEAAVRQILGRTYLSIGMLDEAAPQIEAALALNTKVHGAESAEVAASLHNLGNYKQERGDIEAGVELIRRALEVAKGALGAEAQKTLAMQSDYANALVRAKREDEAEKLLRDTLAVQTRTFGRETSDGQVMVNSLAVLLHKLEQLDEAEALYREALAIGTRVLGAEHPDTLTVSMNLASMLHSRRRLAEAEPLMVSTYEGIRRVFGDSHSHTATAAIALARLHRDQGRFRDALPILEESVAIRRRAEGEDTIGVAEARELLGLTLKQMGDLQRAATVQREVADAFEALVGAEGQRTLNARLNLANTLAVLPGTPGADAEFRALLEICPLALGEDDSTTIIATNSYAVFLMYEERFAEAEPYAKKAPETGRRVDGPDDRTTIITQYNVSSLERELGRLDAAESLGRETLEAFERVFGPTHPNTATAHLGYARTLTRLGRHDDARREFGLAIAIAKAALGEANPGFCAAAVEFGRLLLDTGHASEAEAGLREATEVLTRARGAADPRAAYAQVELGRCLGLLGRFAEAEPLLVDGHRAVAAGRRAGHSEIFKSERYLAGFYTAWNAAAPDATRAAKATEWQTKADAGR